jgi:hypothetical protein
MSNVVELTTTQQVLVTEVSTNAIEVVVPSQSAVVAVVTEGPQGPQGPAAVANLYEMDDVNVAGKVDKSVLYYDAASAKWKGDDINTVVTLTDGGAF